MRLNLGQDLHNLARELPSASRVVGSPVIGRLALHDGSIVAVCGHGVLGRFLMSVLDHLEQALILLLSIDDPGRVEHLVAAVPSARVSSTGQAHSIRRLR